MSNDNVYKDDFIISSDFESESNSFQGNGYAGFSMSNNALSAYAKGHRPESKWKKSDFIQNINYNRNLVSCSYNLLIKQPIGVLKKLLLSNNGEYHHTSIRYNTTLFYHFDTDKLSKLTDDDIQKVSDWYNNKKSKKREANEKHKQEMAKYNGRWEASYVKRSADGRHKKTFNLTGTANDGWFYIDEGVELKSKKLKIGRKDFSLIKRLND